MWDGITYVDQSRSPIISEGYPPVRAVVTNAGPSSVVVMGWDKTKPEKDSPGDVELQLWPGNTVTLSASLIRAKIGEGPKLEETGAAQMKGSFAALAWRIVW